MHGSHVEDYCGAPRGGLTTRCHGYIIGDKSDEGQDASLRVEMGNVGLSLSATILMLNLFITPISVASDSSLHI